MTAKFQIQPERRAIVEAWDNLMMAVAAWGDEVATDADVINTHQRYQNACRNASEGYFELTAILYAPHIVPDTYPMWPVNEESYIVGAAHQFILAVPVAVWN